MKHLSNRIKTLRKLLKAEVEGAKRVALLFSAGKDSRLLLHLMSDLDFDLIAFPHLWTTGQRLRVLKEIGDRPLYFYSPTDLTFTSPYAKITYMIGGYPFKICMEHSPSIERCGIEIGNQALHESALQPSYYWDLTMTGTKQQDEDLDVPFRFEDLSSELHRFSTPLWDWTDSEVLTALVDEGVDYVDTDTGTFEACMACVETPSTELVHCPKLGDMIQGKRA